MWSWTGIVVLAIITLFLLRWLARGRWYPSRPSETTSARRAQEVDPDGIAPATEGRRSEAGSAGTGRLPADEGRR